SPQLVDERPAVGRADEDLGGPCHAMGVGVLARLVDVKGVVRVLEGRDLEPAGDDAGDYFGEERRFSRAAPAGEADDAHPVIIAARTSAKAKRPTGAAGRLDLSAAASAIPRLASAPPRVG